MCGIFCICSTSKCSDETENTKNLFNIYEACKMQINRRGPDFQNFKSLIINDCTFLFGVSVLWLQGHSITHQPIETDNSIFIYNGDIFGGSLISDLQRKEQGDAMLLFQALEKSKSISETLSNLQGPFAFIYLDKEKLKLYFGHDIYGRRSLLIGSNANNLVLTSVACKEMKLRFLELPAIGTFCYDLHSMQLEVFPWNFKHSNFVTKLKQLESFIGKTVLIKEPENAISPKMFISPTVNDLFCLEQIKGTESCKAFPSLLSNEVWLNKVSSLQHLLEVAIEKRIGSQPKFCHNCIKDRSVCNHALLGVLFSGGVDCAILALLADKFTEKDRPIDLLNVAFNIKAPDRITGLETLNELKQLRPQRNWNFVAIDVTQEELELERKKHIADLIYPLHTVLDDSLGCALWFASRGQNQNYKSPCRVLLVGMGADELFGGYTKHRAAFKRGNWIALHKFLEEDWQNISHRNLARDDRVVSDHGRQLRTPYLDENVVHFVRQLNCWERTFPTNYLPHGIGEKILLRSLAFHLGLKNAAYFKKRALQFGSRIANSKENAHDVSPRL